MMGIVELLWLVVLIVVAMMSTLVGKTKSEDPREL